MKTAKLWLKMKKNLLKGGLFFSSLLLSITVFSYGDPLLNTKTIEVTENLKKELIYVYSSTSNNCRGYIGAALNDLEEADNLAGIAKQKILAGIKYPAELSLVRAATNSALSQLRQATQRRCEPTKNIAQSIKLLKFMQQIIELEHH